MRRFLQSDLKLKFFEIQNILIENCKNRIFKFLAAFSIETGDLTPYYQHSHSDLQLLLMSNLLFIYQ
jgi:hypothetical protein